MNGHFSQLAASVFVRIRHYNRTDSGVRDNSAVQISPNGINWELSRNMTSKAQFSAINF